MLTPGYINFSVLDDNDDDDDDPIIILCGLKQIEKQYFI